ncbi:hypothetical protein TcasGA2_TC016261 [Tribolium castaneum]|uniref:Uncharacterized protein n=1 Tax=Tribolium castaneum TaxID=7070 RepID=A0A139WB89_TRICA|nr:hypothetical protein TcasGA2_TC016261 [Tribolium castaneum]
MHANQNLNHSSTCPSLKVRASPRPAFDMLVYERRCWNVPKSRTALDATVAVAPHLIKDMQPPAGPVFCMLKLGLLGR